ncbi:MAG: hypothetical protein KM312_03170 [Hydrogenibacillus schlegelii]|uniref:Uncharacterized protein n=1 Tax=Hydrogenibacillus schlegelii TaxID=1484 RepID=A0A947CV60_HYDSH|nr:hypothetical protein [Hydrogenibacillus schlegelii]MBT9281657.1 hypothetical protein [Hydrogenibacillus schlegelii]
MCMGHKPVPGKGAGDPHAGPFGAPAAGAEITARINEIGDSAESMYEKAMELKKRVAQFKTR